MKTFFRRMSAATTTTQTSKTIPEYAYVLRAISPNKLKLNGAGTTIFEGVNITLFGESGVICKVPLSQINATIGNRSSHSYSGGSPEEAPSSYDLEEINQPEMNGYELMNHYLKILKHSPEKIFPHNETNLSVTKDNIVGCFQLDKSGSISLKNISPTLPRQDLPIFIYNEGKLFDMSGTKYIDDNILNASNAHLVEDKIKESLEQRNRQEELEREAEKSKTPSPTLKLATETPSTVIEPYGALGLDQKNDYNRSYE